MTRIDARAIILTVLLGTASVVPAAAQGVAGAASGLELSAGAGWGSVWDDETMLGRGVPLTGSAGWLIGERLLLSGELDWFKHTRDAGYLAADGNVVSAFGRASYLFGAPTSRVRAVAGAGLGIMHSTGTLTTSFGAFGPDGRPIPSPDVRRQWTLTGPAYDLHGGVRIALRPRLVLRPEVQWRVTFGDVTSSAIEPPLVKIRTMVHLDVRLR